MKTRISIICLIVLASLTVLHAIPVPVPARLSDAEFWKLSSSMSEQDGTFRSDNLLSNDVLPEYRQGPSAVGQTEVDGGSIRDAGDQSPLGCLELGGRAAPS